MKGDLMAKTANAQLGNVWVGGRVRVTDRQVSFAANAVNRLVGGSGADLEIPLDQITDVRLERGLVTRIVAIEAGEHTLRVRCYGAAKLRDVIDRARRA